MSFTATRAGRTIGGTSQRPSSARSTRSGQTIGPEEVEVHHAPPRSGERDVDYSDPVPARAPHELSTRGVPLYPAVLCARLPRSERPGRAGASDLDRRLTSGLQ